MTKSNKVKPGRKDKAIHELREENRELRERLAALEERAASEQPTGGPARRSLGEGGTPVSPAPLDTTQPPAGMSRLSFHAAVERIYIELFDGDSLNTAIANTHSKLRAFKSQIDAEEWGGGAWGPTITPWEDRMNGSALVKLQREKRKRLAEAQKELHALQAEKEHHPEFHSVDYTEDRPDSEPGPRPEPSESDMPESTAGARTGGTPVSPPRPVLSFTPDASFKQAFLAWMKDPVNTEKPKGANEALEAMRYHMQNGLTPPPDLIELNQYMYEHRDELAHIVEMMEGRGDGNVQFSMTNDVVVDG